MKEVACLLSALVADKKTPSVQYAIFNAKEIIYQYGAGFADVGSESIADENTTYHLYSITKTFTAIAILQLAECGKLDINQLAKKYDPEFPYGDNITVRHLLTHTAGLPNPIPLSWIHLQEEHAAFDADAFFGKIFQKFPRVRTLPGKKYAYSNLGYVLLGKIIEKVSSLSYCDYIRENVIKRINIPGHELDFIVHSPKSNARGYHRRFSLANMLLPFVMDKRKYTRNAFDGWVEFRDVYVNGAAYGGLIGTKNAMIQYSRQLLVSDALLSVKSRQQLFAESITDYGKATGMCLSWFTGHLNNLKYFTHAGGGGGFYCEVRVYPEISVGSVILFNRTGMVDERFLSHVDGFFVKGV